MKFLVFLSFILLFCICAYSQDNNYWNQMPGSRSALLGGAVVGSVRDNSAIFYNPGALGFVDSSSISIAANSFQFERANIENGGGKGVDFTSKKIQTVPLVSISTSFKFKPNSKSTFGFIVFTKNQTSNSFSNRVDDLLDTNILSGNYYISKNPKIGYIGDFNMHTGLTETWIGACYSYKINKAISFGASPFISYRTQLFSKSFVSRVILDKTSNFSQAQITSESYSDISNISSSNLRALGKFGVSVDLNKLKFGIVLTTKSLNLGGTTLISRDISYSGGQADPYFINQFDNSDTSAVPYMFNLNDRQQGLKTTYKSPLSLAAGIENQFKNTKFLVSAEYFQEVATYNLVTPDSNNFYRSGNISPVLNSSVTVKSAKSDKYLKITDANNAVFNFAFAIEQSFNKRFIEWVNSINPKQIKVEGLIISASYRTDRSSYKKTNNDFWVYKYGYGDTSYTVGQRLSFSENDLHHLNIGVTIKRKKSDVHLGFCYSYGSNKKFQALNNISNPIDNVISNNLGAIPDFSNPANYIYKSYSILLGYTYHLK